MQAVVIDDVESVTVKEVSDPSPADDEALVEVRAVGICRTDHEIIEGHHPISDEFADGFELVPGHEWVGEVVETGIGCTRVEAGDRVVGETSLYCGNCDRCEDGLTNLCENGEEVGITRDGALARYLVVPERILHTIPDSLPDEAATFVEPTAVAVHALDRAERTAAIDEDVVIYGDGNIGLLLTAAVSDRWEPASLTVVGRIPEKLDIAESIGADRTIDTSDVDDPAEYVSRRLEEAGVGADVVFEAVGTSEVIPETVEVADDRGTVVFLGLAETATVDMQEIVFKELSLHGSLSSPGTWPRAIDLAERLPTDRLRTGVIGLEEVPNLLEGDYESPTPDVKTIVELQ